MGCDLVTFEVSKLLKSFLLTHPVWDVTVSSKILALTYSISTHTSRVGCDYNLWRNLYIINIFLLTHPVWDVTTIIVFSFLHTKISTHTSRVGCDELVTAICLSKWRISTHTSRVGCDVGDARCSVLRCRFLLTHPVWDVTRDWSSLELQHSISTHTSRVGCDTNRSRPNTNKRDFYSHIPCGMWLWKGGRNFVKHDFYSHIPCGMWPSSRIFSIASPTISTHTSRVGCDTVPGTWLPHEGNFYSHIPCGMWLITHKTEYPLTIISTHTSRVGCDSSLPIVPMFGNISTHTSRVGCDAGRSFRRLLLKISTHTSRVGCDRITRAVELRRGNFYSHIPCGMWPI